jgi:protein tyrosine/serine phosphatase
VSAFIEILVSGKSVMARVLRHLIESAANTESPSALFIHCTTGNNRTGVFIALLLLLLNVPAPYVIREYAISEFGLAETKHINVERLLGKGAFKEYGEVEARRKCERMVGARPESMEGLVREVNKKWAGAEGYFLDEVKLTKDEIERVKCILTVEVKGDLCHPKESNGSKS